MEKQNCGLRRNWEILGFGGNGPLRLELAITK